ncbi:MAG: serine--tRNA ligase [Patescibacteria group bacterium]
MIDIKDFDKNRVKYIEAAKKRGKKFSFLFNEPAVKKDTIASQIVKTKQRELELLQAKRNAANKNISALTFDERKKRIVELKPLSEQIKHLEHEVKLYASESQDVFAWPNTPKDDVPVGDDESGNLTLREVGKKKKIDNPKDYLSLAEPLNLIDMKRASQVSGSRFAYILGPLAQMEFALVQYAQKTLLKEGFTMVVPPVMIKEENMAAMGYLNGGGENETYHLTKDKLYLVGTSEQSIGPMHRDEIFKEEDLPKRYLSFSTCFRREAGSYGKDTKGILRVHQFDKLEMFSFTLPEKSDEEHEFLLAMEEKLWQGLDIPYRVIKLCTGDLGWPSARTYDIETWMPGQNTYREVCSASTTTDYQSRDLNIKVDRGGKKELVHMLNGTAFAIGRTLIAIIENNQQPDGSIAIPPVLQPYMTGLKVIKA